MSNDNRGRRIVVISNEVKWRENNNVEAGRDVEEKVRLKKKKETKEVGERIENKKIGGEKKQKEAVKKEIRKKRKKNK